MTLKNLAEVLGAVLPDKVAYEAFPVGEAPDLPYIAYMATGSDNFAADNVVYFSKTPVRIELYERLKDLALEGRLETALTSAGLFWERDETYISDEGCYLIIYEVTING